MIARYYILLLLVALVAEGCGENPSPIDFSIDAGQDGSSDGENDSDDDDDNNDNDDDNDDSGGDSDSDADSDSDTDVDSDSDADSDSDTDTDTDTDSDTDEMTECEIEALNNEAMVCCPYPLPTDCEEPTWDFSPMESPDFYGCCTGDLSEAIFCYDGFQQKDCGEGVCGLTGSYGQEFLDCI